VDSRYVAASTLAALVREKQIDLKVAKQAFKELEIDPEKADPAIS
jgi:pyruvate dehydrogenase complex dehydrogenase (E1) component